MIKSPICEDREWSMEGQGWGLGGSSIVSCRFQNDIWILYQMNGWDLRLKSENQKDHVVLSVVEDRVLN